MPAERFKKKRHRRRSGTTRGRTVLAVAVAVCCVCMLGAGIFAMSQWGLLSLGGGDAKGDDSSEVTYDGKTYVYNDHLSNYLFLGVDNDTVLADDATSVPGNGGQADAIYLVSYNRAEKSVAIIAIPRDTMTQIETFSLDGNSMGFATNHLSLQYAYGDGKHESCKLMENAVSGLFDGLPINGYVTVNLESLPHLTELVGYVDVVVPDDSLEAEHPEFKEGATVRLTSSNTETFVRSRDIDVSQSALTRIQHQKVFINAFLDRVRELQSEDASTVTTIYEGLQQHMLTNLGADVMVDLVEASRKGDIETIPGTGTTGDEFDEYEVDEAELYRLIIQDFYQEK